MKIRLLSEIPSYYSGKNAAGILTNWDITEPDSIQGISTSISAREFSTHVTHLALRCLRLNIPPGSHVILMSQYTTWQYLAFDFALIQNGVVVVPLDRNMHPDVLKTIITEVSPACCIVQSDADKAVLPDLDPQPGVYSFSEIEEDLMLSGGDLAQKELDLKMMGLEEEKVCQIIYTSGSTGRPKGVMLSHQNILSVVSGILQVMPLTHQHRVMSFLPMSHIFERVAMYSYLMAGSSIDFVQSPKHALPLFRKIHPHFFATVPRILEQTFKHFKIKAIESGYLSWQLMKHCIEFGSEFKVKKKGNPIYSLKHMMAFWFGLRKLSSVFGNRLVGIVVGGAALEQDLHRIFWASGIELRAAYGLTETSAGVTFHPFHQDHDKIGTVGRSIPGVRIEIDQPNEDGIGEVLVHSPGVMLGYFNNPEANARCLVDKDTLKTGDLGTIDKDGFLRITGYNKSRFKNSSGLYIEPQAIEERLTRIPAIQQAIVIGSQKPFNLAIIIPEFQWLERWCKAQKIHWTAMNYMVHNPKVTRYFEDQIEIENVQLLMHEKIQKIHLGHTIWTPENGLLTRTYKVNREAVVRKYAKVVRDVYAL